MAASRADITEWFNRGVERGNSHMVIVCDTFDHDDYPVYCDNADEARKKVADPGSMQRVMEVYHLRDPLDEQINKERCFNYGEPRP
jgi:dipeptidase